MGLVPTAPASAAPAAKAHPFAFTLAPIVGVRTGGPDSCSVGPISGTNCPVTIMMTGSGLPTVDPSTIGVEEYGNSALVTIEDNNDGSNGWLAGHDTDTFTTCKIIVGASTSTELILQVGDLGPTCPGYSVMPGDSVKVTLFNPDFSVYDSQTVTAATPAADPNVPGVSDVTPPYGPVSGGTNDAPGTGAVTVTTSGVGTPLAAWFGVVATSNITPVDATHFSVVPPPSVVSQDNEGISVQLADSVAGTSPQHCAVLLPTGCPDEFMYLSVHHNSFTSPPLNFNWTASLGGQASVESRACGINGSSGTSTGLTVGGSLIGGPVSVDASYGISESALGIPETLVGNGTLTVENPIQISIALSGTVSGCEQIAIPDLAIPGIAGFYFVVGGSITAAVTLTVTINAGTYTLGGSFIPGSNADDVRGVTMSSNCVDADGNPTTDCVTTAFSASLTGTLAVSPLWLQIGPDFANVGAGLTAAATGTITYPPLAVDGDICVAGNWVAQVNVGPLSGNTGGSWLGPFSIFGNPSLCPLGSAGNPPTPTTTGLVSSTNPSAVGQAVTYTASVSPTPDGGTVAFTDNGTAIPSCESVAVDASGNAQCTATYAAVGSHPIVATYSGDSAFAGSASSSLDQEVSASVTTTATGVSSSVNPSAVGQAVTYTASVSPVPDGGTVTFTDGGTPITTCEAIVVDGSGNAQCSATYAAVGSHPIVATYNGDAAFSGSASSTLDQEVSASVATTATGLGSSANPSSAGQQVSYTASVSPVPDGGTVSFTDGGTPIATCAAVAVDGAGHAPCAVTYAGSGSHPIVATYSGDTGFAGSTSSTLTQQVDPVAGGFNATATPPIAAYRTPVTLAASGLAPAATGTVTFTSGATTLCTATVSAGGASCPIPDKLAPGAYPVTATYSGNPATPATTNFTIVKADTAITATAQPTKTTYGNAVTLSVSGLPRGATGNISFTTGVTTLCVTPKTGAPSCPTAKNLYPYTYSVTATYPGNANYNGSTATTTFTITKIKTVITAAANPTTAAYGHAITLSVSGLPKGATGVISFVQGPTTLCLTARTGTPACATASTLAPGTYAVTATYPGNFKYKPSTATTSFTITAANPTIATVAPTSGALAGGQTVTITGTHFAGVTAVKFGTTSATSYTVVSATKITAVTPAHVAGPVDVRVTTLSGTSAIAAADHYTFAAAPKITSVTPASGTHLGGKTVTIVGTDFTFATAVKFGTTAATSFTVVSATKITAVTPAHAAGLVDVRVTAPAGTSKIKPADNYTFT